MYDKAQEGTNTCENPTTCLPDALCLYTPVGSTCLCSETFVLNAIGKMCIKQLNYTAPNKCLPGFFPCKNGNQCIDAKFLCNRENDCFDESDESLSPDGPCNYTTPCAFKCDQTKCLDM